MQSLFTDGPKRGATLLRRLAKYVNSHKLPAEVMKAGDIDVGCRGRLTPAFWRNGSKSSYAALVHNLSNTWKFTQRSTLSVQLYVDL